ncbi:MAG: hypothetical protein WCF92_01630 [bacterium]
MQKYTPEEYNKILDKLPQIIKETVLSSEATNILWEIGEKHKLQFDKIAIMHDLVMDTMMGIVTAKSLPDELAKELDLSSSEIAPMVEEINEKIFKPVREIMEKTFKGGSPNKLRTISTVQENDDEHLHLTKHDILREIENPSRSVVRKEISEEKIVSVKKEEKIPEISKTSAVEEYNQELSGNKIDMRKVDSLPIHITLNQQGTTAEQKTKIEEVINPERTFVPPQKTIAEMKLSGMTNTENGAQIAKETNEETPKPSIDPYREPAI